MLELITKSKIRKRIILLFIYNQNKEFYLSQISKLVHTSVGTAQRELNRLLDSGFIFMRKKGGLNIYKLNKNYAILEEVQSIVKKTFGIEAELKRQLSRIKNITFAFLFGSYVKGGFKSKSDIDLFIIGEADEDEVFKAIQRIENLTAREINYHLASENDFCEKLRANYFHKNIVREFILLKGEENEFRKLISQAS